MTPETHLTSLIRSRTTLRAATLVALWTLTRAALFADPPKTRAADSRAATVSLAGLDLSTPEGARAAFERLKIVAQRLCWDPEDDFKIYT